MSLKVQAAHNLIGNLAALLVYALDEKRPDLQSGLGGRAANAGQHRFKGTQRLASPVDTDGAKQPMLDRVSFGGTRRIVADRYFQSQLVGQLRLDLRLPQPRTPTVAPAPVTEHQQTGSLRKVLASKGLPPLDNHLHRKFSRVSRLADVHVPPVVVQVIKAIGNRLAEGVEFKIMVVDQFGFPAPTLSSIFEVADQLFFLGIHADHRPTVLQKEPLLAFDVLELGIPIRMLRASQALDVRLERIAQLLQQTAHRRRTRRMALVFQAVTQMPQAAAHPFLITRRVSRRFRSDDVLQRRL